MIQKRVTLEEISTSGGEGVARPSNSFLADACSIPVLFTRSREPVPFSKFMLGR